MLHLTKKVSQVLQGNRALISAVLGVKQEGFTESHAHRCVVEAWLFKCRISVRKECLDYGTDLGGQLK